MVKVGGRLLAQKTQAEDIAGAAGAIELLGGSSISVVAAPSGARRAGTVVIIGKTRPTPAEYPRRPGFPSRKPL
jgi:16S rRNA (guanine527-N7)-methyltransferase